MYKLVGGGNNKMIAILSLDLGPKLTLKFGKHEMAEWEG